MLAGVPPPVAGEVIGKKIVHGPTVKSKFGHFMAGNVSVGEGECKDCL